MQRPPAVGVEAGFGLALTIMSGQRLYIIMCFKISSITSKVK